MPETARPIEILMVEDNPHDVRLTREAFMDAEITNSISVAPDGEEALDFLYRRGAHAGAPRPDLIFLDLNLPKKNGCEVLAEIKADPDLRRIPVLVFTTSGDAEDIRRAYDLHVNAYIRKPMDLDRFTRIVAAVEEFWFSVANLPPGQQ